MTILSDFSPIFRIVLHRVPQLCRQKGLAATVRHCAVRLWRFPQWLRRVRRDMTYDREMGVETSRLVAPADLGVAAGKLTDIGTGAGGVAHMPSPCWALVEMLSQLEISYPDYNFIDLGSGMGRVVLMASELPFRKVIGVEFSPELHRIAEANVASRQRAARAGTVELLCQDARDYEFPPQQSLVYMFNSFRGGVMKTVLDRIERWFLSTRNDLYVLYFNPVCDSLLAASPVLTKIKGTSQYSIYHVGAN